MDKSTDDKYFDVDSTVMAPSTQRVRNILTLEERVRAIHAYDIRPMYTRVAKMFNCSWEQIKNIVTNREAILGYYEATKRAKGLEDPKNDDIRQEKITFLGACLYEYIQRAQFHAKIDISEELLRTKALEFRDIIKIDSFTPKKVWINHFKATYNFSLSNRQIKLTRTPPSSLDLKDIMTYCTKNKSKPTASKASTTGKPPSGTTYRTATRIAASKANISALEGIRKRKRKIIFLEKCLYEYVIRCKSCKIPLTETILRRAACDMNATLKIENFVPDKLWLNHFATHYNLQLTQEQSSLKKKSILPFALNIKDIISYCGRLENKHGNASTSDNSNQVKTDNTSRIHMPLNSNLEHAHTFVENSILNTETTVKQEIIDLDEEELQQEYITASMTVTEACEPSLKNLRAESKNDYNSERNKEENENLIKPVETTTVHNYSDALRILKPLEEFALLEENYRAIGLISQLEEIFKNPPKK